MDLELSGRAAIVSGASRGIGLAIAQALAAEGAQVTICARAPEPLEAARAGLAASGATVTAVVADVTVEADRERVIAAAVAAHGGVDVLVNNAGGYIKEGDSLARFERAYALNVTSTLRMSELAKPYLAASASHPAGGAIVNITSIYGRESGGATEYNATKAAQISLTKSLGLGWIADGIRVNSVAPGSIAFEGGSWGRRLAEDPDGMRKFVAQEIPGGRFGRTEEIAAAVTFLASARASWVVGATLNVDGGQSRANF